MDRLVLSTTLNPVPPVYEDRCFRQSWVPILRLRPQNDKQGDEEWDTGRAEMTLVMCGRERGGRVLGDEFVGDWLLWL